MIQSTVNGKKVIFSESFLLNEADVVEIGPAVPELPFKVTIKFITDDSLNEPVGTWAFENDSLKMEFKGWKNQLGTALTKATKLGELNGQALGFTLAHHRIGNTMNLLHIQFLLGGVYE